MTFLAHKLRDRFQVRRNVEAANSTTGGFDRSYETITTIWGNIKHITSQSKGIAAFSAYVRGTEVSEFATHIVKIRRVAVENLGKEYATGFASGFNIDGDLNVMKDEYFLFSQRGSTTKGNLYQIMGYEDVGSRREYLRLRVREIEEQGTGYPA